MADTTRSELIALTAEIASAYVGNNKVSASDLPSLVHLIHQALSDTGAPDAQQPAGTPNPAVPVRKSIHEDYLICLEDGRRFKSLKRHLRTKYGLSPEAYRTRWGLPMDYPMVASSYAAFRSAMAKQSGLGQTRRVAAQRAAGSDTTRATAE